VKDRIQSWASILLGAAVVVLVGWLTTEQMSRTHVHAERVDAGGDAGAAVVAAASDAGSGSGTGTGTTGSGSAGNVGALDSTGDGGFSLTGLTALLDAGAMPTGAPRTVRLGVVLVQYAGAEGAPSSARAKPDAFKHAVELAEQAKGDWKAAVKAGDTGSSEDIGRIPRGVLDRTTELTVFSLDKNALSEPLDTPRGYWVVKRIE
jgi:hypothetical protein